MKHIKFNKTICGVDFLLNVLEFNNDKSSGLFSEVQSADFFQIIFIKEARGRLLLNESEINVSDNSIIFISQFQKYQWKIDKGSSFRAHVLVFQEDFLNEFFADKYFSYRLLYFYQTQSPSIWLLRMLSDPPIWSNFQRSRKNLYAPKVIVPILYGQCFIICSSV